MGHLCFKRKSTREKRPATRDNDIIWIIIIQSVFIKVQAQQCRREGRGNRYIPGLGCPEWGPGPHYFAHVFVFLDRIRRYQVVICRVDGTCDQRPSCLRRSLLCFLTFFHLPVRPCWGARIIFFTDARTRSRRPWSSTAQGPIIKPAQEHKYDTKPTQIHNNNNNNNNNVLS